jgi:hypothetical protein
MSRRRSIVGAQSSAGVIAPSGTFTGNVTAARFLGSANNTAAAPTFLVEPAGNSGLYWEATEGVAVTVDGVRRASFRVDGLTEVVRASSNGRVLAVSNSSGSSQIVVCSGSPEGVSTCLVGGPAYDITNGRFYLKRTGSGNTGWVQIDRCESGTYTPTGTVVTNLDSVTPALCSYTRVGDRVTVFGVIGYDPTASSACSCRISLPIVSNFAATTDANGFGHRATTDIIADATNDQVLISMTANTATAASTVFICFQYTVI